jgi:hypothetical protein
VLLILNDDDQVANPSVDQLRQRLPQIDIDEFCILSLDDERYIQCFHNDDDTYLLEYRDGSADKHFAVTSDSLLIQDIVEAFIGFLENDSTRCQTNHAWKRVDFDEDFEGDTFHTHYVINGKTFHRIRVGREREPVAAAGGVCLECDAKHGDFHVEACLAEECPFCHGPLQSCDCK